MSRLAILFSRLGPYHHARIRAAARLGGTTAIEFCGASADKTYAWAEVTGADGFDRITLFEKRDISSTSAAELAAHVGKALDRANPDVVAIPGWSNPGALAALRWCLQARVPTILMSESTALDSPCTFLQLRRRVKLAVVKLFTVGLVGGAPHKDYLQSLMMPVERIFTGYDVVDNDYFFAAADVARIQGAEARARLGLPERYFLACCRFIAVKNLPRLLQAFARYRQIAAGDKAWHLVLVGDGELRPAIETHLSDLGLRDAVHTPGFKQYAELPAYYGLAGAFVHASIREPWGLVVNEAMAAGLPIIVSDHCGCAQDLVRNGINGFTFDPEDVNELAQHMQRVAGTGIDRAAMGKASQEIISHWTPATFAESLWQAAEWALRSPVPRHGLAAPLLLWALMRR